MSPDAGTSQRPVLDAAAGAVGGRVVVRVLHVTNMFPTAREPARGIIVARLDEGLRRCGLETEVVSISGDRGSADYLFGRGRVARATERFDPDVVHVHFGYTALTTSARRPRVVSFYGDDLNGESTGRGRITFKSRLGVFLSREAARHCERSIAVSRSLRDRLRDERTRDRCTVIRDAVDTRLFCPGDRLQARRELGISPDEIRILFPHSLRQRTKRVDVARAAVAALRESGVPAELWVVNDRPPSDMPAVYRAADALIVTSDLEGGPSCVKEAIACGLPVVSVPVGDVDVLREAGDICAVAPRAPVELARALRSAIERGSGSRRSHLPAELELERAVERVRSVYEDARRRWNAGRSRAAIQGIGEDAGSR